MAEFTQDVRRESILTASSIMTEPGAVISTSQPPQGALDAIGVKDVAWAWVVDEAGKFRGMLTLEQIQTAAREGRVLTGEGLSSPVTPVAANTPLEKLISLSLITDHPIPVVDEDGKLVGEIHRRSVANGISGNGGASLFGSPDSSQGSR